MLHKFDGVFKCMFQMFHLFQTYVASVLSRCCKSRSGCCIYVHVASVCFKCFTCFIGMLQVFYIDVAKVDRDVAHVAMAIHVCFKCRFQIFHLFQMYVVSVSSGRCKGRSGCCIYM